MRLRATNLCKSFGQQIVLKNVNLDLEDVHTLALIGPSGGGKSTLLRIIAGLEIPDSGRLYLNDQEIIYRERELMAHRRTVGTVFQAFNLFPHLTALQNIMLPLEKVHQHDPAEARQVADAILERFGLSEHGQKTAGAIVRVAKDSGWRSPEPSRSNRSCCCSMNRRLPSIPR